MTAYYVRSGAGGSANGTSWANAYLTLAAALSGKAAGDVFYIAEDHAESTGSNVTLASPGTSASPCFFYCVDHAGSVPPVSADLRTTATISTSGNNSLVLNGTWGEVYGITFTAGNSTGSPTLGLCDNGSDFQKFVNSALHIGSSGSGGTLSAGPVTGGGSCRTELYNTTVQFANTSQSINVNGTLLWRNTASAISGATLPNTLIIPGSSARMARVFCEGVDLSALGSGKTLVSTNTSGGSGAVLFKDCKLGASVTICGTPSAPGNIDVDVVNCDSGSTNYRNERYRYAGTLTTETTIVLSGGASDGTTGTAYKIVTTANSRWDMPFEAPVLAIWNDTTGSSKTATVQGIWGGGAVPNNDDIFLEIEYLGASGSPLSSMVTSTKADNLASGSALSGGSGSWGGSTTSFAMSASFTPQKKGWVYVRVRAAKASSTFYVDPLVTIT